MLTDPQTLTINAVANTLPRISTAVNSGSFQKDDTTVKMDVSSQYGKRTRRLIKVIHSKIAADPLISSTSVKYSMSVGLVIDVPVTGYTVAEQKQIVDAVSAWLTASSGANITKVLGGEN